MNILLLDFKISKDVAPLALGYIKAYADKHTTKHDIKIESFYFDIHKTKTSNFNLITKTMAIVDSVKPDVVGFSCYMWNIDFIEQLSDMIKQKNPCITQIMGGPEIHPKTKHKDFLIHGHGEKAFLDIVKILDKHNNRLEEINTEELASIKNITYRGNTTGLAQQDIKLDELPNPFVEKVFNTNLKIVQIETARGCVFNCSYCNYAKIRYEQFSLEYIKEVIKTVFQEYDPKVFTILDANFNYDEKRMIEICSIIKKHNKNNAKIVVELNPMLLNAAQIKALEDCGEISAEIGLQSTDKEVNKLCKREIDLDKIKKNIGLLNQSKIKYKFDLIFGLLGDNFFKFLNSVRFVANNCIKQKFILAHQLALLSNTDFKDRTEFLPITNNSSFISSTDNQDSLDLLRTRIFTHCINQELRFI